MIALVRASLSPWRMFSFGRVLIAALWTTELLALRTVKNAACRNVDRPWTDYAGAAEPHDDRFLARRYHAVRPLRMRYRQEDDIDLNLAAGAHIPLQKWRHRLADLVCRARPQLALHGVDVGGIHWSVLAAAGHRTHFAILRQPEQAATRK